MKKINVSLSLNLIFLLLAGWGYGQVPYFDRFYQDQEVRKATVGEVRVAGRSEEGKLLLSEQDAIEMALANNLDINVARHRKLSSFWDISLQESAYDPMGSMGFNWHQAKTPASSLLQGGDFLKETTVNYQFGYTQPFSTGTSLDISFTGNKYKTSNFFTSFNPAINSHFQVMLKQDLLKGFWNSSPEYEIAISRNNHRLSDEAFRQAATEVIAGVQDSFWALSAATESLEVAKKALELAEMVHSQNLVRLEAGSISELEMAQTEAELASRREELIRARYSHANLQNQLIKLITNLERPEKFGYEIVVNDTGRHSDPSIGSYDDLLEIAFANRPEMIQARIDLENLDIRYRQSRDNLKPSLSVVGGYEQYGLGGVQIIRDYSQGFINPGVIEEIPGGLNESLDQLFSGDYNGFIAGVDLRFPISNTAARARNAKAKIALNQGEMMKLSIRQQISLEVRTALNQIEMNRARIEAARAAVAAGEKRMEAENARFEAGMGTTRELIEAQRDLLAANATLVEARASLEASLARLDKATGETFAKNNIKLLDAVSTNVN